MKHKKKKSKVRTIGDLEHEARIRNKKLQQESKAKIVDSDLVPNVNRLSQIQQRNYHHCSKCRKKKPIAKFYTLYSGKKLKKIWPSCKSCMRLARSTSRRKLNREQIIACFTHYGNNKLSCSRCNMTKEIYCLTLVDTTYKTAESIVKPHLYSWLYKHGFPNAKIKLMCYNCTFLRINKHTNR